MKKSYLSLILILLCATACSSDDDPKPEVGTAVNEQGFVQKVVGQTWIADAASAQAFNSVGEAVADGILADGSLPVADFRIDGNIYTEYAVAADGSRSVAAYECVYMPEDGYVYVYDVNNLLRYKMRILSVEGDELTVAANYGEVEVPVETESGDAVNVRQGSGYVTYRMHKASASEAAALPADRPEVKAVPTGTYSISNTEFAAKVNGEVWVTPLRYKHILHGDGQVWDGAEAYIYGVPMMNDFQVKGNEIYSFFSLNPGQKYLYPEYKDADKVFSKGRCQFREREGVLYVYTACGYMEPILRVENVADGVLTISCRFGLAVKDGQSDPTSRVVYEMRQPDAGRQADYDNAMLFQP